MSSGDTLNLLSLVFVFWSVKQLMSTYLSCTRPTETKLMIIQATKQKQKMKHVENKRIALPLDIFFSSLCFFPRTLAPFVISCNIYGKRREKSIPMRTTITMKIPWTILSRKFHKLCFICACYIFNGKEFLAFSMCKYMWKWKWGERKRTHIYHNTKNL